MNLTPREMLRALATVVCVLLGLGAAVWLMLPGVGDGPVAPRGVCKSNLQMIGMALLQYHEHYGSFPPAYVELNGKPAHSWRVLLLPFLEQRTAFNAYKFDEPWNSPHNLKIAGVRDFCYRCPEDRADSRDTSYVAIVGADTCWPAPKARSISEIRDENSILLVEMADSGIHWMEPRDLNFDDMSFQINDKDGNAPSSRHKIGGINCLVASIDGNKKRDLRVIWLQNDVEPDTLRALITSNGGEVIKLDR